LDCINVGGEWILRQNNFDNVFLGSFTLYQISTLEGWFNVMLNAVDARGIDQVPIENSSPSSTIFFIAFIFIGGEFTMNLFQTVVISTYMQEKEQLTNN
jgi:Ion transport protein